MTKLTPMKAIRKFCVRCSGNMAGVRDCPDQGCALWRYRFGMGLRRYGKKKQWRLSKKTHLLGNGGNKGRDRNVQAN